MTAAEFFKSQREKKLDCNCIWRVTMSSGNNGEAVLLWFLDTKWYAPRIIEGRKEVGYLSDIYLNHRNWRVEYVHPV